MPERRILSPMRMPISPPPHVPLCRTLSLFEWCTGRESNPHDPHGPLGLEPSASTFRHPCIWWARGESNSHDPFGPPGSEPGVTTNSTTRPGP